MVLLMRQRRNCPASSGGSPTPSGKVTKTTGSMSGASHIVRPTATTSLAPSPSPSSNPMSGATPTESMSTSTSSPTREAAKSSHMRCASADSSSLRASRTSRSNWLGISAAGVPSSSLYANAPIRWKPMRVANSTTFACAWSLSPGKPAINVVRSTRPGMRSRSLPRSFSVCCCVGRFMDSNTRLSACCSGMSTYLHTCGMVAMASMSSSVK
mmetsp:Transcript_17368/g.53808  ORF Transcript_17368/g.53808 Transcript_17368/m.53808 type:complete len:212 (-) Transcript_17368:819-1454(-)